MGHDVIVVGARCAGATLAALLARSGVKTLVVEAQALPSDMPMSTHYIHPPGMDVLDELGVGETIRRITPPSRRPRYQIDSHRVFAEYPDGRAGYCVRRVTLDSLLQNAASAAGAQVRDRCRVVELIEERGRVCGVVVETPSGRERLRADLVVGADGRHSTVARLTRVEEYLTIPMTRAGYWFYFPTPSLWREDPRYRDWDAYVGWERDGLRYIFQCDGDLLLLAAAPPNAEMRSWQGDYRRRALAYFRASEVTRPIVEASEPTGKGVGLLNATFFYRRPVGPGFALVGDAGSFKDFVTGHGMTDAFVGAKGLHAAILAGDDAAYERYWRERDVETLPLYLDAARLGKVSFNNPFNRALFAELARNPALAARLPAVADRRLSPFDAFAPRELAAIVGKALLRGRFDVLPAFLATGREIHNAKAELRRREALLAELSTRSLEKPKDAASIGTLSAERLAG